MKKQLIVLSASVLLLGGLSSCSNNKNIELSNEQSLGLRAASGLTMMNNVTSKQNMKFANETSNSDTFKKILPSIDVLLNNDFNVKTTEVEEGKFDVSGVTYTFKLNINFVDVNEKETNLNLYYNFDNELTSKYDEAIVGIVALNETKIVDFKSTVLANIDNDKANFERKLSLYVGTDLFRVDINEVSHVSKGELLHKFEYALVVANQEIMSYAVNLNSGDRNFVTFSVLGMECKLERVVENNTSSYLISVKVGETEIQTSLKFTKTVNEDGSVSYSLVIG